MGSFPLNIVRCAKAKSPVCAFSATATGSRFTNLLPSTERVQSCISLTTTALGKCQVGSWVVLRSPAQTTHQLARVTEILKICQYLDKPDPSSVVILGQIALLGELVPVIKMPSIKKTNKHEILSIQVRIIY